MDGGEILRLLSDDDHELLSPVLRAAYSTFVALMTQLPASSVRVVRFRREMDYASGASAPSWLLALDFVPSSVDGLAFGALVAENGPRFVGCVRERLLVEWDSPLTCFGNSRETVHRELTDILSEWLDGTFEARVHTVNGVRRSVELCRRGHIVDSAWTPLFPWWGSKRQIYVRRNNLLHPKP